MATDDGPERSGHEHRTAPAQDATRSRLRVSRRWFLALLAGGVAALFGGRRLFQEATEGGAGVAGEPARAAATKDFSINTVDKIPAVPVEDWVIEVGGLVADPVRITREVWEGLPRSEQVADFHCVEGWTVSDVHWSGIKVADVLQLVRPLAAATHVNFCAFDPIYTDSLPLALARDEQVFLADRIDGAPLPRANGGPVRLVVPSQMAYKSVKWVRRIELTDDEVQGYWEYYGYPSDAPVTGAASQT